MFRRFPYLATTGFRPTSPPTPEYNCIAWTADEVDVWWWPDPDFMYFWPAQVPRQETIEAFVQAYQTLGYEKCDNAELEFGYHKIAIYALFRKPTHAAKQLPSGKWSSKLGQNVDIEHDVIEGVCGPEYGSVEVIMRKPV